MTLDEFLDDYVPRVLKPKGTWWGGSCIRLGEACPLTAESGLKAGHWRKEAERLGLQRWEAADIAMAADFRWGPHEPELIRVRARLLAGLGLSEGAQR